MSHIYALSSVKFSGVKLWLCKKSDKYEVCRGVKIHPKNSYKIESLQDGHMLGGGGLLPDGSTIDPMHLLLAPFQMASSPELQNVKRVNNTQFC